MTLIRIHWQYILNLLSQCTFLKTTKEERILDMGQFIELLCIRTQCKHTKVSGPSDINDCIILVYSQSVLSVEFVNHLLIDLNIQLWINQT